MVMLTPPHCNHPCHTVSSAENPRRPHGNPPSGHAERNTSTAVHRAAVHHVTPGKERTVATALPNKANQPACTATSASQAPGLIEAQSHQSSGPKKPRPKATPARAPARHVPDQTTALNTATAGIDSAGRSIGW